MCLVKFAWMFSGRCDQVYGTVPSADMRFAKENTVVLPITGESVLFAGFIKTTKK